MLSPRFFFSFSPLTSCVLYSNERSEARTLFSSRPWMQNSASMNSSMTPVCSEATEKWKQMLIWSLTWSLFADLYLWSTLGPLTKWGWGVISDPAPFSDGRAPFAGCCCWPQARGSCSFSRGAHCFPSAAYISQSNRQHTSMATLQFKSRWLE